MFLMCTVDCYTFFTVSMVTTGFLAGTMIFVLVFLAEFCCKFLLQPQTLCTVSLMKLSHCIQFLLISFNLHSAKFLSQSSLPFFYILHSFCFIPLISQLLRNFFFKLLDFFDRHSCFLQTNGKPFKIAVKSCNSNYINYTL